MSDTSDLNIASTFVLGSHKIGDSRLGLSEYKLIKLLEQANLSGFLYLDTAPIYGLGSADRLLSQLVHSDSLINPFIVDSKIGLHRSTSDTRNTVYLSYEKDLIQDQISQILKNYSGHIRYIYLHYPPKDLRQLYPCLDLLGQCVSKGLIEGIGLSNFSYAQILHLREYADISSLQLYFAPFRSHYPFSEILSILHYASLHSIHCSSYGTLSTQSIPPQVSSFHTCSESNSYISSLFSQPLVLGFDQVLTSLTKYSHLECLKNFQLKSFTYSRLLSHFSSKPFSQALLKF